MKNSKTFSALLLVIAMLAMMLSGCDTISQEEATEVTSENVWEIVDKYCVAIREVTPVKKEVPDAGQSSASAIQYELPDITNYPLSVRGGADCNVEIFLPLESEDAAIAEFIAYAAEEFNSSGCVIDGKTASVSIRALEADLAQDYIVSGAYVPDGYIAPNSLYSAIIDGSGIASTEVTARTAGNTMGIAILKEKYDELKSTYSDVNIKAIVDATKNGKLAVGYKNPTKSPTGLNFVLSTLAYFDAENPLSMEATTDFAAFQSAVPVVSYSTAQMKNSVSNGTLNAFVTDYQAFSKDSELSSKFEFLSFGLRQDNPLYAVSKGSEEKAAVLQKFAEFVTSDSAQEKASAIGFNQNDAYTSNLATFDKGFALEVLKVWKTAKTMSGPISVMFVADVSGSMSGEKIDALKESLMSGISYISDEARVGLMSYSSSVYLNVPIDTFDQEQKEYFAGAVDSLRANGGTCTNEAILAANKLLHAESAESQKLIIVLSDGLTGGWSLKSVEKIFDLTDVPIYTIGYGKDADEDELTKTAQINNGTYVKATTDNVSYLLKSIFEAET